MNDRHPLQLRDLTDGYRFIAACPSCSYKATIDPATIITRNPDARFWTVPELAKRLRCTQCKRRLMHDVQGHPTPAQISQRLAIERNRLRPAAFQAGVALPPSPKREK
ncbi:MAG: hypothetical protein JJU26_13080 [Oceanicaulis sp.]|uniref:hypothetical protein n=1 Tax=Glycocaulis sp. TaxID=1969725 RepID=UPI0025C0DD57|nr:hypothetical protein [Glycocaulis sp.]MCC5982639.1 hypothetical protein [Oceanicaulis sp.]MCH8522358.1 hypothetical protein [Glycocaulis sp.]